MNRRGFTLIEVLFTLFILSSLVFALALNTGQYSRSSEGRTISNAALAELRAARAKAQQSQTNVALAFDIEGSSFFRYFEGAQKLKESRTINLVAPKTGCVLWPDLATATSGPTPPADIDISELAGLGYILFTADGDCFSNGPFLAENLNLLTCVAYDGTFNQDRVNLSAVTDPSVIQVNFSGSVRLATRTSAGLANLPGATGEAPVAQVGAPHPAPTEDPVIQGVTVSPGRAVPSDDAVSLGRSYIEIYPAKDAAGVPTKNFPTLNYSVKASSPSGEELFLAAKQRGPRDGAFTYLKKVGMLWEDPYWVGSVSWKPPTDAQNGDLYEFTLVVEDKYGNSHEVEEFASFKLQAEIVPDVRLVIQNDQKQLFLCNARGGEPVQLRSSETDGTFDQPIWTKDGQYILCLERAGGKVYLTRFTGDGQNKERIEELPSSLVKLSIDPGGFYCAYSYDETDVEMLPEDPPTPPPSTPYDVLKGYKVDVRHIHVCNVGACSTDHQPKPLFGADEFAFSPDLAWSEPQSLHYSRLYLEYPADTTQPPVPKKYREYATFKNRESAIDQQRTPSSELFADVSSGIFSPIDKNKAVVVTNGGQDLSLVQIDNDGNLVTQSTPLSGSSVQEVTWALDGSSISVKAGNELHTVNASSGVASNRFEASGITEVTMDPEDSSAFYYLKGGELYYRKDSTETKIAAPVEGVIENYAVTD